MTMIADLAPAPGPLLFANLEKAAIHGCPRFSAAQQRKIIEKYLGSQSAEEMKWIEENAKEMGPLRPGTRFSICIPAAAHEEGDSVARTINAFSRQSVGAGCFEIALFLNYPQQRESSHAGNIALTRAAAFRGREQSGLDVRVFELAMINGTIGYIRKLLDDAVMLRSLQAGKTDLLLLRTDADIVAVHPAALETYEKILRSHPEAVGVRGRIDYDFPSLMSDPMVCFGWRLFQVLSCIAEHAEHSPATGGANFVSPVWANALAGGYNPLTTCGEDVEIGRQMLRLAEPEGFIARGGSTTAIFTSGRRACAATSRGWCPGQQWSIKATGFDADNADIRNLSWTGFELQKFHKLLAPDLFIPDAAETVRETLDVFCSPGSEQRQEYADRAGRLMGFVYDDKAVRLHNYERLLESMTKFAASAENRWKNLSTA